MDPGRVIMGALFVFFLFNGCWIFSGISSRLSQNVVGDSGDVIVYSQQAADGLELKAVGKLVKQASNAEELEKALNQPNGVNNLDLNEDGKVDYIRVTEYGTDQAKGFSLTAEPAQGEEQEIVTIEIEKDETNKRANMTVSGNQQIYGPNHHYRSGFGLTEVLLFSYLFSPHSRWISPYSYGAYPRYYGAGYGTVPYRDYNSRTGRYTRGSSFSKTTTPKSTTGIVSPNKGKTATRGVKAPLRRPTASQKSFQSRNPSKYKASGSFGKSVKGRSGGLGRSSKRPSVRSGFGRSGSRRFGK